MPSKKEKTSVTIEKQDRLFNFRPIFFAAVFLSFGIFFAYLHIIKGVSARWLLCLLPCAATLIFFCCSWERFFKCLLEILIVGMAFLCGFCAFSTQLSNFSNVENYNGRTIVIGRVVEKRKYQEVTELILDDLRFGDIEVDGRLNTYLSTTFCDTVELSDRLLLNGRIEVDVAHEDENGFRANDVKEKLRYYLRADAVTLAGHEFDLFLFLRTQLQKTIALGMDETPAAVMTAVLFGDRSGIELGLYDNIRMGGIAHIFAVSGLHVGAFFAFCLLLFKKTGLRRLPKAVRFLSVAFILLFYAGICGFSSSVLRATVMCLVGYAGSLLLTRIDALESVGLAAIVILLLTPSALFEVGFQLSFTACLGIVLFSKPIRQVCDEACLWIVNRLPHKETEAKRLAEEKGDTLPIGVLGSIRRKVTSFLSVTIAAQIATSPLLLYYYGYLSGWTLLLNCVFVPIFTCAFSLFLFSAVLATLLPFFAVGILYVSNVVWTLLLLLFQTADFTNFAISGLRINVFAIIPYYAACLFITDKFNLSKSWKIPLFFVGVLAFVAGMVALNL